MASIDCIFFFEFSCEITLKQLFSYGFQFYKLRDLFEGLTKFTSPGKFSK